MSTTSIPETPPTCDPTLRERLWSQADAVLSLANSRSMALLNGLMLSATLLLVLTSDRTVTTGLLIVLWGSVACYLAYRAGVSGRTEPTGLRVVVAYAAATLLLYLLLNGCYRLLGI